MKGSRRANAGGSVQEAANGAEQVLAAFVTAKGQEEECKGQTAQGLDHEGEELGLRLDVATTIGADRGAGGDFTATGRAEARGRTDEPDEEPADDKEDEQEGHGEGAGGLRNLEVGEELAEAREVAVLDGFADLRRDAPAIIESEFAELCQSGQRAEVPDAWTVMEQENLQLMQASERSDVLKLFADGKVQKGQGCEASERAEVM